MWALGVSGLQPAPVAFRSRHFLLETGSPIVVTFCGVQFKDEKSRRIKDETDSAGSRSNDGLLQNYNETMHER